MSERWASGGAREVEKRRYAFEALTAGSAGRREAAMQRARRVCASGWRSIAQILGAKAAERCGGQGSPCGGWHAAGARGRVKGGAQKRRRERRGSNRPKSPLRMKIQ
ncbi:hypothetical protein B0H14DRAFT_2583227 [Mycena olivaceomarginata]|nr:hypothetical protein B0H14DRAFT_2583227 [Mycena olivaceomarginata]